MDLLDDDRYPLIYTWLSITPPTGKIFLPSGNATQQYVNPI